jgi:hypothetical protein
MQCNEVLDRCEAASDVTLYAATTNLLWEVTPSIPSAKWQAAIDACGASRLCGQSDWRLPTITELRSLIDGCPGTEAADSCVTERCASTSCVDNMECLGCANDAGPQEGFYCVPGLRDLGIAWSSTTITDIPANAWLVHFRTGGFIGVSKEVEYSVRCVRTGNLR